MLISKQNRRAIFENLFKGLSISSLSYFVHGLTCNFVEGVMVAAKDFNAATHPEVADVSNLEVIKSMQSLTSKGYVKTQCAFLFLPLQHEPSS